jgi:hypothetical protein
LPTVYDNMSSDDEEGNLGDSVTAEENTIPIFKRQMLDTNQNVMNTESKDDINDSNWIKRH